MAGRAGDRNAWCVETGAFTVGASKNSKVYDFGEVLTWKSEKIVGADRRLLTTDKFLRVSAVENVTGGTLTVTVKTADTLGGEGNTLGSDAKAIYTSRAFSAAEMKAGQMLIDTVIDHNCKRYVQVTFSGSASLSGKIFAEVSSIAQ